MTNIDEIIQDLKKKQSKASPGPYTTEYDTRIMTDDGTCMFCDTEYGSVRISREQAKLNRDYIVAVCNAIPELIAEIEKLRSIIKVMLVTFNDCPFATAVHCRGNITNDDCIECWWKHILDMLVVKTGKNNEPK